MNKEMKLTPELRFPGFENAKPWSERKLGNVGEFVGGGTPSTSNSQYWDGDIQWYTPTEVKDGVLNSSKRKITEDGLKNSSAKLLPIGTILITTRATIGDVAIANKECTTNQGFQSLIVKETEVNLFWYYWIILHKHELVRRSSGSTFKEIGKTEIKVIPTLSPRKEEQQKIASCLYSLDELLAAHNDKLDALKEHKKGLMQNLFPQERETVPKVRFKEFENDGGWIKTTVEKLIQEKVLFPPKDGNHGSIHPKSSDYVKTGIPFIMASDLKNGKIDFSKCAYLKKEQADSLQKGFAKSGDVLLTHKGTVGEVALLGELEYPYIMLTPQVTYYRVKDKSKLVNGFLSAFFNSDFFQKNLLKVSGGGTRAYVGITKQKEFDINYPKNPEEQKKIASCLLAVDELITAQSEKIEQLQQHKKGLMQGLFPKIES
jgi:type I restriction enzyme S subunit